VNVNETEIGAGKLVVTLTESTVIVDCPVAAVVAERTSGGDDGAERKVIETLALVVVDYLTGREVSLGEEVLLRVNGRSSKSISSLIVVKLSWNELKNLKQMLRDC